MPVDLIRTGKNIEKIIHERGFNSADVAQKLGVSPQCVYKWRRGTCLPDIDHLLDLAELLDVSLEDLLVK
ncbi:DNA-binding transcriptional regulator, XRE-family HTH domain [Lachnospiraceae bacterium XBB2008]|nr:DNA-binding transcriptional regulator, XRE-family HTH domain [Lachnospiraceae bacterium XBB2008]